MEIAFAEPKLALVETDRAAETRLQVALIESLRDKLVLLRSARDERVLRQWKSLHYEKLSRPGDERSIRLNKQWRLVFTIDTKVIPNKLTILGVEDYH